MRRLSGFDACWGLRSFHSRSRAIVPYFFRVKSSVVEAAAVVTTLNSSTILLPVTPFRGYRWGMHAHTANNHYCSMASRMRLTESSGSRAFVECRKPRPLPLVTL